MTNDPLSASHSLGTSPPLREGEDGVRLDARPLPFSGEEVSRRSRDGEGEVSLRKTRRKEGSTERARGLRKEGTKAEALLWLELKANRLGGFHFVRQLPVGRYFGDFAYRKEWLIVELDGSHHAGSPYDRQRDIFLNCSGYSVMRFWNDDVLHRRTSVCETILAALGGRLAETVNAADLRFSFVCRTPESPSLHLDLNP